MGNIDDGTDDEKMERLVKSSPGLKSGAENAPAGQLHSDAVAHATEGFKMLSIA